MTEEAMASDCDEHEDEAMEDEAMEDEAMESEEG